MALRQKHEGGPQLLFWCSKIESKVESKHHKLRCGASTVPNGPCEHSHRVRKDPGISDRLHTALQTSHMQCCAPAARICTALQSAKRLQDMKKQSIRRVGRWVNLDISCTNQALVPDEMFP